MSKHPIQSADDLMRTTGMEFGLMAEPMRRVGDGLRKVAERQAGHDRALRLVHMQANGTPVYQDADGHVWFGCSPLPIEDGKKKEGL